jgi:hypothetical protein
MNFLVQCDNSQGRWECDSPALELHVELSDKDVTVSPNGIPNQLARDLALNVAGAGSFENESLADAVISGCTVGPGKARNDPDLFLMDCRNGVAIEIVRDHADGRNVYRVLSAARAIL